jgi:hypothetical protein
MVSCAMIYIYMFYSNPLGIQVILRLLPQQFERLQCLHYRQGGFMKYADEMASRGMIYT